MSKEETTGNSYIELDGNKIELPKEFNNIRSDGKISLMDIYKSIFNNNDNTKNNNNNLYDQLNKISEDYINNLIHGDFNTIILTIIITVFLIFIINIIMNLILNDNNNEENKNKNKKEEIILRDFTIEQLKEFNGGNFDIDKVNKDNTENPDNKLDIPIYVALKGIVYDVSVSKMMYGKGSGYHIFAGREATRAMAKFSFEEFDLINCYKNDDFGLYEINTLEEWILKFEFKYPKVGHVSIPLTNLKFTKNDLEFFNGKNIKEIDLENNNENYSETIKKIITASKNRINSPILVAINKNIIDVSYGGMNFYGTNGPYSIFAGKNITKALATMSLKPEDVLNSHNYDYAKNNLLNELTPEQIKTLKDWEIKFIDKKKYPVIGQLI